MQVIEMIDQNSISLIAKVVRELLFDLAIFGVKDLSHLNL